MRGSEVEAVLAHEISHVANGDMVTRSLLQGVLNTFVIFLSRVLATVIESAISRGDSRRRNGFAYFGIVMLLQFLFGILATIVVMAFSRWREYRADRGAAKLEGAGNMIAALEALKRSHPPAMPENMRAFGINGSGALMGLFRSHPPLDDRIARLRAAAG